MASQEQAAEEQKSSSLEEVGLGSQHEGDEQGKGEGEQGATDAEPRGATAAAPASTVPQPPYEEDFNPFSEEGIAMIYELATPLLQCYRSSVHEP